MSDNLDTDRFKRLLEERQAELQAGLADLKREGAPVELDQSRVGRLSRMDALQQQAMAQESFRRAEQELSRIDSALGRIESGYFGYCVKCDEEIGLRRLEALPATLTCIECADG